MNKRIILIFSLAVLLQSTVLFASSSGSDYSTASEDDSPLDHEDKRARRVDIIERTFEDGYWGKDVGKLSDLIMKGEVETSIQQSHNLLTRVQCILLGRVSLEESIDINRHFNFLLHDLKNMQAILVSFLDFGDLEKEDPPFSNDRVKLDNSPLAVVRRRMKEGKPLQDVPIDLLELKEIYEFLLEKAMGSIKGEPTLWNSNTLPEYIFQDTIFWDCRRLSRPTNMYIFICVLQGRLDIIKEVLIEDYVRTKLSSSTEERKPAVQIRKTETL